MISYVGANLSSKNEEIFIKWLQLFGKNQGNDLLQRSPGETGWLSGKILSESCEKRLFCKILADWKVMLQDSGRMNGYLARIW